MIFHIEFLQGRVQTLTQRLVQAVAEQASQALRIEELEALLALRTEERDQAREQLADKEEQLLACNDYAAELASEGPDAG